MHSVSSKTTALLREREDTLHEKKLKADQLKKQDVVLSEEERDLVWQYERSVEQEGQKMKEMSERVRDYKWSQEHEKIEEILQSKLNSLLNIQDSAVKPDENEDLIFTENFTENQDIEGSEGYPVSSPDESEYLFHLERWSKDVRVLNIPRRQFRTICLEWEVAECSGFCHVKNELYLGGGQRNSKLVDEFWKISPLGKVGKLESLPTAKERFPMTYWEREEVLITLGGYGGSQHLQEVQQFMRMRNQWKALPSLPYKTVCSSATVVGDVLYNMGGCHSINSVEWLDLVSEERRWNSIKTVGEVSLSDHYMRDATVVNNQIV